MDLFAENLRKNEPLAKRLAPQNFSEFVGQQHIIGEGRLLRRAIEADRINSLIFSGPPGCGKTGLARLIANYSKAAFEQINAVNAGVADLRKIVASAKERLQMYSQKTVLFVDEIHRFNKAQQDALLPDVESGLVVLIGTTTENPFFSVNPALLSRSQVFEFKPLSQEESREIIANCLNSERGFPELKITITDEARDHLVRMAGGDARKILNALELAVLTTHPNKDDVIELNINIIEESIQQKKVVYAENEHYDIISAFIKSMRGSDPDAAVYWLAKMVYAGEDPRFIARRIVICAAEDVGNADPLALIIAQACFNAVAELGYPEARIVLSQAAIYVATAPKSNAGYLAIDKALSDIKAGLDYPVPDYLKNAVYEGEKKGGKGKGYKYAHDFPKGYAPDIDFLPETRKYYEPTERGYEQKIRNWLAWLKKD